MYIWTLALRSNQLYKWKAVIIITFHTALMWHLLHPLNRLSNHYRTYCSNFESNCLQTSSGTIPKRAIAPGWRDDLFRRPRLAAQHLPWSLTMGKRGHGFRPQRGHHMTRYRVPNSNHYRGWKVWTVLLCSNDIYEYIQECFWTVSSFLRISPQNFTLGLNVHCHNYGG